MKIREGWEQEGNKLVMEHWYTVDELMKQPWYDEYIADTTFMSTILDTDTDGEVRIVYTLHLDQKTGEYTLSLYGAYFDLEEEIVDFKNDPIAFADFMKKYVYEPEDTKTR